MTTRIVSITEGEGLTRSIAIGTHTLTADEPEPIGTDAGPTPGELLLAALGSCTSMTLRAFADRHHWRSNASTWPCDSGTKNTSSRT
ncbi:hypothetical protein MBT84_05970 [Streptomyces sp. MBT84]|uniref:OsmC family protein n=1 Tax=Streptomyces sp. MBT84 TaxID=1488414 RepID=UPI001D9A9BB1|nr:OsmC family protein [Streptomyces sp. MBT84]MBW8699129.1 hypothetical protein [Streptomyces sp. MBT84]